MKAKAWKQKCLEYLQVFACESCGYKESIMVFDFHHVFSETKEFNISSASKRAITKWPEVYRELDKCLVLCANCHRKLHCKEFSSEEMVALSQTWSKRILGTGKVFVPNEDKDRLGARTEPLETILSEHTKRQNAEMDRREDYRREYRHSYSYHKDLPVMKELQDYD